MYKVTYINPGETDEIEYTQQKSMAKAVANAETPWEDGTEVLVWKLVKRGTAKSVMEWDN